jgi:hypothetical protein
MLPAAIIRIRGGYSLLSRGPFGTAYQVRTRGQGPFDSHPIEFALATTFALPLEE